MPLIIEGGRIPGVWAEKARSRPAVSMDSRVRHLACVRLALINNMPDPALEDTELQFFELLDIASGNVPVFLRLYSLTGVPRTDRGLRHLNSFYFGLDNLWNDQLDGVIVTGTEPRQPNLRDEPYWSTLGDVLDWAERNTVSTVLSCLAAHAGVLHSDGIERRPLPDKQFGVFESGRNCEHELTAHVLRGIRFPHSRWNEVQEDSLTSCGYVVLTKSAQAGVDLFVKQKKKSLFVHFQGHPEYGAQTLFKEYRRDIRRFLGRERETYPTMPHGYFDAAAAKLLAEFQKTALAQRHPEQMAFFPETVVETLQNTWQSSATCIYRNWLQYVMAKKAEASPFAAITDSYGPIQRKGSAVL
jgi:homoserine O-succinyltransferase/O-acetyltransferase